MRKTNWSVGAAVMCAMSVATVVTGCAHPIGGLIASDERRIWVVRDGEQVYRCADGAAPEAPPRPICVRSVFVDGQ